MATSNVMRIDFVVGTSAEDGIIPGTEMEMSVLYNKTIISEEEVRQLIFNGMADHDLRVVYTTKIQADFLKGIDYRNVDAEKGLEEKGGEDGKE